MVDGNHKKDILDEEFQGDEQEEYVYLATNDAMPGLVKIGIAKDVDERMGQLSSSTGVPQSFEEKFSCKVQDSGAIEYQLHQFFDYFRVKRDREFFKIDWRVAQSVLLFLSGVKIEEISGIMEGSGTLPSPNPIPLASQPQGNLRRDAVNRINAHLGFNFRCVNRRTVLFNNENDKCLVCLITNCFHKASGCYWFSVTSAQKTTIEGHRIASSTWVAFACQTSGKILLMSWHQFLEYMPLLGTTEKDNSTLWHVFLEPPATENKPWMLRTKGGDDDIPATEFLIPPNNAE